MNSLNLENFKMFNAAGLKEICSINRDIFSSYNQLLKDELRTYVKSKIENNDIIISPYIWKEDRFIFFKYRYELIIITILLLLLFLFFFFIFNFFISFIF